MNRFIDRVRRHRIAAVVTHDYPVPEQVHIYERLEAVGDQLDAEVAVFHSVISDPRGLPPGLKHRVGTGILVRRIEMIHAADADHFRRVIPERFASLVASLTRLTGDSELTLLKRFDVQAAFSYSRLMQAWAPDIVCAVYLSQHSFFALVASHLLGVPSVFYFPKVDEENRYGKLMPLFLATAAGVVLGSPALVDRMVGQLGEAVRGLVQDERGATVPALAESMRRMIASPRASTSLALGPRMAFVTEGHLPVELSTMAKPFLILGAERTGSNMLLDTLAGQPKISCAGELFNPRVIQEGAVPWLNGVKFDRDELASLRASSPVGLHARLLSDGERNGASWVGFKLLYYHGIVDNRLIRHLSGIARLKIVHLLRADRLRRWISHYKAQVLDSWYTAEGSEQGKPSGPLEIDVMATLTDFAYVELMEDRYRATFDQADMIELDYDEISSDLGRTGRMLGEFLGMELGELRTKSKKTGVRLLDKAIANLEDLRAALKGTRWEPLGQS